MYSSSWKSISELRGVTCHMGSHSVTCHPTQVNAPCPNPSQIGRYSIYLPQRDGKLSRPRQLDSNPTGIEPTTAWSQVWCPNRYATKPTPSLPLCHPDVRQTMDRQTDGQARRTMRPTEWPHNKLDSTGYSTLPSLPRLMCRTVDMWYKWLSGHTHTHSMTAAAKVTK